MNACDAIGPTRFQSKSIDHGRISLLRFAKNAADQSAIAFVANGWKGTQTSIGVSVPVPGKSRGPSVRALVAVSRSSSDGRARTVSSLTR